MMDRQVQVRMQLLAKDAELAVVAFCQSARKEFLLLPLEDYGTAKFTAAVEESMKQGFVMVALIALRSATDGLPLIEDEPMPGASDENVLMARQVFCDNLMQNGIIKQDSPVN
jgi:hypothetical protein